MTHQTPNGESVITNVAQNTAFIVPEWALLNNDTDPDSTLDVTALSNINSLTASLVTNAGSVTITDTGGADGSFTYTATGIGGIATDTANVSVDTVATTVTNNYADNFNTTAFNNTDGSVNWATSWVEDRRMEPMLRTTVRSRSITATTSSAS